MVYDLTEYILEAGGNKKLWLDAYPHNNASVFEQLVRQLADDAQTSWDWDPGEGWATFSGLDDHSLAMLNRDIPLLISSHTTISERIKSYCPFVTVVPVGVDTDQGGLFMETLVIFPEDLARQFIYQSCKFDEQPMDLYDLYYYLV